MGEFRIGRKSAQHSYPIARRTTTQQFARNFASGYKEFFSVPDVETPVPWEEIDSVSPWDAGTTYSIGDIVSNAGSTWISLADNNVGNEPPSAEWAANTIVPITPITTGVVVIQGVIALQNETVADQELTAFIFVNGVALPVPFAVSAWVTQGAPNIAVPFLAQITGLPLGVTAEVQLIVAGSTNNNMTLEPSRTTMEVREMQTSTG